MDNRPSSSINQSINCEMSLIVLPCLPVGEDPLSLGDNDHVHHNILRQADRGSKKVTNRINQMLGDLLLYPVFRIQIRMD